MKKVYQYNCPDCHKEYQVIDGVECVNKFGWSRPDFKKEKVCTSCEIKILDSLNQKL